MVILDNNTRWNSTYYSIEAALKLRKRVEGFCYEWRTGKINIANSTLNDAEWDHLQEVFDGLAIFKEATLAVEGRATKGHHGAIWEWLPIVEALLNKLQKAVVARTANGVSRNDPILVATQCAWNLLKSYYAKSDKSYGIYGAATLLHPTWRKLYFDRAWKGDQEPWIPKLIDAVKDKWQEEYQGQAARPTNEGTTTELEPSILTAYLQELESDTAQDNQFDSFIYGTTIAMTREGGAINWWCDERNVYPELRQMALDLLAIPATSAEVERVFSSAKQLLTPRRNRMKEDTIEMLELMKYWWQRGIIAK